MLKKLFWPCLVLLLTVAFAVALWSGRAAEPTYVEMACLFEERSPGCVDSLADWKSGLAFYDSSVAVSRDPLKSLTALLWDYWNIEFAGAGEAAVSKDAVLPLQVLKNRKSGCMGLAWLAMMVAEARNLPLNVILLPGHVFLSRSCMAATIS